MGLMGIDTSMYQNAPQSFLRAGLDGYDAGMQAVDAGRQRRGLLAKQQQDKTLFSQQQAEVARQQAFTKTLGLLSQQYDYRTPEGQQGLLQGLGKQGFGVEAMELSTKLPKQAARPDYQFMNLGDGGIGVGDPTTGNYEVKTPRDTSKADREAKLQADKDAWTRKYQERQLNQSAANITKDNELAAAKYDLSKTKTDAELARKAIDLPESEAQADAAVSLIDQMIGSEDRQTPRHPGFSGAVGVKGASSLFGLKDNPIGGTDAADFAALYDQVKGGAFLEAVAKMKGSGALSDTEGKAAAGAITRMKTSQSEGEFLKAAAEFRTAIKSRKGRVMAKAGASAPASGVARPASRAERDNLPKGTRYIGPDGNVAVKQ